MAAFCSTILNVCGMIKLIGEVTGVFDATLSYSVVRPSNQAFSHHPSWIVPIMTLQKVELGLLHMV